jgi:hypothetical protein
MAQGDFLKAAESIKAKDKDTFAQEAKALAEKHLGKDCTAEAIPFGMRFREKAPTVLSSAADAGTSASVCATLTIPPDTDTDPPD